MPEPKRKQQPKGRAGGIRVSSEAGTAASPAKLVPDSAVVPEGMPSSNAPIPELKKNQGHWKGRAGGVDKETATGGTAQ